jgi:RNA polymerase sigma-70 factor (ECF subfamily)
MRGEGDGINGTDPGAGAAGFEAALPHLDAAWALARYLLRDDHDAQDAVQDAYLRALRRFDGRRGGDLRAWLLRIVRNVCMDVHRGRARSAELAVDDVEEVAGGAPADAELLRGAGEAAVRDAIERLPPEFREVILLREFEEMSYKRIAAVTGAPAGTVMSRLARARALLRRFLAEDPRVSG